MLSLSPRIVLVLNAMVVIVFGVALVVRNGVIVGSGHYFSRDMLGLVFGAILVAIDPLVVALYSGFGGLFRRYGPVLWLSCRPAPVVIPSRNSLPNYFPRGRMACNCPSLGKRLKDPYRLPPFAPHAAAFRRKRLDDGRLVSLENPPL